MSDIVKLLKVVLGVEGVSKALGEDGVKLLSEFKPEESNADAVATLEKKVADAEGKAAGILEEKKKAQARADEVQAKLDELESKDLGDVEKLQKQLEKETAAKEIAEANASKTAKEFAATQRKNALHTIGSEVKWLDSVPTSMRTSAVEQAFVDVEDLSDKPAVKGVLESFVEGHKGLIQANSGVGGAGGAGGAGGGGGGGGGSDKPVGEQSHEERKAALTGDTSSSGI